MKKTIDKIDEISMSIIRVGCENATEVLNVLELEFDYLYYEIIKNFSNDDKDKIILNILNRMLKNFKNLLSVSFYNEMVVDIDKIMSFYNSEKSDFNSIKEKGNYIANDLLFKVIDLKGQPLQLPIDISIIKEYFLKEEMKKEQFYNILLWIVIRYISIYKRIFW